MICFFELLHIGESDISLCPDIGAKHKIDCINCCIASFLCDVGTALLFCIVSVIVICHNISSKNIYL